MKPPSSTTPPTADTPDAAAPVVSFVSAGPGAADLITLRGLTRLKAARVVLFDALTDPALREPPSIASIPSG